jgi:hypothetical protein
MLSTKNIEGSGGAINDGAASTSTTYSGTKVDADNATQDAAITAVDSEVDVTSSVFHAPAGIGSTATGSVAIVPDATAASLASATDSATVRIGHGASPGTAGSQAVSVLIGRGVAHDSDCNASVVIGADTANLGGSFSGSVIIGYNSMKSTGNCSNTVLLGGLSGPAGGVSYSRLLVLGRGIQETVADYGGTVGAFTFADDDVVIGSSAGATQQPLIHASNDTSARHWSPGAPADLGTSSRPWVDLHLSGGITGAFDYVHYQQTTSQGSYADNTAAMCTFSTATTASSLGNITTTLSGTETRFNNATSETRRWHVAFSINIGDASTAYYATAAINVGPGPVGVTTPSFGTSYSNENFGVTLTGSAVVEVPSGESVAISALGDTPDSSTWQLNGGSITIAELPR